MNQLTKSSSHRTTHHPANTSSLDGVASFWSRYSVEMPTPSVTGVALHERCEFAGGIMTDLIFKLTVNQLATSIRLQGIDEESMFMLNTLETLVIAGEIPFSDFMSRMQNLFAQCFDKMDPALLAKLSAIATD